MHFVNFIRNNSSPLFLVAQHISKGINKSVKHFVAVVLLLIYGEQAQEVLVQNPHSLLCDSHVGFEDESV